MISKCIFGSPNCLKSSDPAEAIWCPAPFRCALRAHASNPMWNHYRATHRPSFFVDTASSMSTGKPSNGAAASSSTHCGWECQRPQESGGRPWRIAGHSCSWRFSDWSLGNHQIFRYFLCVLILLHIAPEKDLGSLIID